MNEHVLEMKGEAYAHLLLVDDDPHIRSMFAHAFNLIGYDAEEAASGEEALATLDKKTYDVMILDLLMPDIHGLDVMRKARKKQPELLIIVLTGHASLQSAIRAIRFEAADYLIKPVRFCKISQAVTNALQKRDKRRENLAHIVDEVLDKLSADEKPTYSPAPASERNMTRPILFVPPVQLDRHSQYVILIDDPEHTIELTEGETAVLSSLMLEPDHPLSCQQLVCAAWGYYLNERKAGSVIRPCISRLRRKIEANPKDPQLIRTVRGRGYLFAASSK